VLHDSQNPTAQVLGRLCHDGEQSVTDDIAYLEPEPIKSMHYAQKARNLSANKACALEIYLTVLNITAITTEEECLANNTALE
jgi:hypothetical protein